MSATLKRVLAGQLCSGCGACVAIAPDAITMETVAPGFARPRQSAPISREADRAIAIACPGSTVAPWPDEPGEHIYWGPYRQILTGHATDDLLRYRASSGGLLSALLIQALHSGQVDAVLHVKADPDHPTRNIAVISRTPDDIIAGAGSRYAPSSPLAALAPLLDGTDRIAFVGKPCDASAVRGLSRVDPRVAQRVPLVLSFFCGGVPSHAGAEAILATLGIAESEVAGFRYRGDGWPGQATATLADGSTRQMSYMDSWGRHLSSRVQFRCKICPDAVGGVADIVCADAWFGDERGYPLFEEQDGRSLLIARTLAGQSLLEAAARAGAVSVTPVDVDAIHAMQPYQAQRKRLILSRLLALRLMGRPVYKATGLSIGKAARQATLAEQAHSFAGMVRRALWP